MPKLSKKKFQRIVRSIKVQNLTPRQPANAGAIDDQGSANQASMTPPDADFSNDPEGSFSDHVQIDDVTNIASDFSDLDSFLLNYKLKYNLSWPAIETLGSAMRLSSNEPVKNSKYSFLSAIGRSDNYIEKTLYFCRNCPYYSATVSSPSCPDCNTKLRADDYCLIFSIESQLREIVNASFVNKIKENHWITEKNYSSVQFSTSMLELRQNLLSGYDLLGSSSERRKYITLSLNTDGVSESKSFQKSLWIIFLVVNELPMKERYKLSNVILAGVHYSPSKPNFEVILPEIVDRLVELEEEGFQPSIEGIADRVYPFVNIVSCDKPAKSAVSNTTQFNGKFGCPYCLNPGETVAGRWVYPLRLNTELRNPTSYFTDRDSAISSNKPVHGIKGKCIFENLKAFRIYDGFILDYMHGSLLGIGRNILSFYFNPQHKSKKFSLFSKLSMISSDIKKIKTPFFFPRELEDLNSYDKWKANQIRAFFLSYAFPVLQKYLSGQILEHLGLFSAIMHLCLLDCITSETIAQIDRLCKHFLEFHQKIYGEESMTSNVHDVCHYSYFIKTYGAFFNYSLFPFEEINRKIHQYSCLLDIGSSVHSDFGLILSVPLVLYPLHPLLCVECKLL